MIAAALGETVRGGSRTASSCVKAKSIISSSLRFEALEHQQFCDSNLSVPGSLNPTQQEGFKSFRDKFGEKAFGLHHRLPGIFQ